MNAVLPTSVKVIVVSPTRSSMVNQNLQAS